MRLPNLTTTLNPFSRGGGTKSLIWSLFQAYQGFWRSFEGIFCKKVGNEKFRELNLRLITLDLSLVLFLFLVFSAVVFVDDVVWSIHGDLTLHKVTVEFLWQGSGSDDGWYKANFMSKLISVEFYWMLYEFVFIVYSDKSLEKFQIYAR